MAGFWAEAHKGLNKKEDAPKRSRSRPSSRAGGRAASASGRAVQSLNSTASSSRPQHTKRVMKSNSINWEEISKVLPTSKEDPQQIKARAKLWKGFDANGNGYCSLAECQKGLRDVIHNQAFFEAKPAILSIESKRLSFPR